MQYSDEQIKKFADECIEKLMNDYYTIEDLIENSEICISDIDKIYSDAIQNTNENSNLFKSTYED